MTELLDWSQQKVVECAGIRLEDVTPEIAFLAKTALDRCYYIDQAANELLRMLQCCPVYRGI